MDSRLALETCSATSFENYLFRTDRWIIPKREVEEALHLDAKTFRLTDTADWVLLAEKLVVKPEDREDLETTICLANKALSERLCTGMTRFCSALLELDETVETHRHECGSSSSRERQLIGLSDLVSEIHIEEVCDLDELQTGLNWGTLSCEITHSLFLDPETILWGSVCFYDSTGPREC